MEQGDHPVALRSESTEESSGVAATGARAVFDGQAAILDLFEECSDAVLGYCIRIVKDPVLAEDVMQQVFLQALRDVGRFEGKSSLRTWLFAVAGHRCLDAIRSRRRADLRIVQDDRKLDDLEGPAHEPHKRIARVQLLEALDSCMSVLSEEVRATVLLRFHAELTFEQMAAHLGASAEALQMRVARAMPVLRRCLEGKGWKHE